MPGDLIPAVGVHAAVDRRLGEPGTVPLVLLHGAGGSHRHWHWTVDALPPWITPVALDLPGHGASDGPVPASVDDTAGAVRAALHELGVPVPFGLAGHSLGGLVAIALASSGGTDVSHLALLATAARIPVHPDLVRVLATGADDGFVAAALGPDTPEDRVRAVVGDITRVRLPVGTDDIIGARITDLTDRLDAITARTLVAWARRDPVISPRRSRALAAGISGADTAELDSGHYLMVERPATVAAHLASLLAPAPAHLGEHV
jgi:pimeloyl-ACP methyl ester carboxylesterase